MGTASYKSHQYTWNGFPKNILVHLVLQIARRCEVKLAPEVFSYVGFCLCYRILLSKFYCSNRRLKSECLFQKKLFKSSSHPRGPVRSWPPGCWQSLVRAHCPCPQLGTVPSTMFSVKEEEHGFPFPGLGTTCQT